MAMTMGGVNSSLRTLNSIQNSMQRTTQQLATGSRYPGASYGGAAYATLQRMTGNIGAISQSVQNTQNMSSMVKTAEDATSNTIDALKTIKETLLNAANGTNNNQDRSAMQNNINQLVSQIDSNSQVQYNGMNLLDGSKSSITVAGVDGYENISLGNMSARALGLTDDQGNVTIDLSNEESVQNALSTVDNALSFVEGVDGNLQASLEGGYTLDEALDEATTQGAQLQRLEFQEANYRTMSENEQAAASNMGDTDMARAITDLRSQQTQEQLALYATKMFNQNRSNIVSLLQP